MADETSGKKVSPKRFLSTYISSLYWRIFTYFIINLAILLAIFAAVIYWTGLTIEKQDRADVAERMFPYGNALHNELSRRLGRISGIAAFIESHFGDEDFEAEFQPFAARLYETDLGVRNFQVLAGTTTIYVYPMEGNTQMIGLDWLKVGGSNTKYIKKAVASRKATIIGPFEAHPGVKVISAVEPVYSPDGSLYGLGAAVYDFKPLIANSGLDYSASTIELAVRTSDKTIAYGDAGVFRLNPVIKRIRVGHGYWEVAAVPLDGWAAHRNLLILPTALSGLAIAFLLAGVLTIVATRQDYLTGQIAARTKEIAAANTALSENIAKEKDVVKELASLNRLYSLLSKVNETIVRAPSKNDLLEQVCRTIVEAGGYRMCWIGLIDKATNRVVPAGTYGVVEGYFDNMNIVVPKSVKGHGPKARALMAKKAFISNDVEHDPDMAPWVELSMRHEYRSEASFPLIISGALIGSLNMYSEKTGEFTEEDARLLGEVANNIAFALDSFEKEAEVERNYEVIRRSLDGTVKAIAAVAEHKDPYTAGHEQRVVEMALAIGRELEQDEVFLEGLRIAATLHDIGKIYIPAEILSKPGALNDLEFDMIKQHPRYSYDILSKIDFPWPIADMALQHHERMDGSGYPQGIMGKDIKLEARILAVADVIEAMGSHRPYRPALTIEDAMDEIRKGKGRLYDEKVAAAALKVFANGYKL